jgi:hypothetical protein
MDEYVEGEWDAAVESLMDHLSSKALCANKHFQ